MKFLHLSDLHIGKRLNEISLLDDQKHILEQILVIVRQEKPDGVILAGDIYDKSVPSAEAVEVFDDFLVKLANLKTAVFMISGNHDSPERISFGGRLMAAHSVYISDLFHGTISPITMKDEFGEVNVYLLPFLKPSGVRRYYPDEKIDNYTDAMSVVIRSMNPDTAKRNILVAHQFVTGASICESEEMNVGGLDQVDSSVFADFDYVALGHIHGPQNVGSEKIRYCGTPLKYSFSECNHQKSVTVVEFGNKKEFSLRTIPLEPMHDLKLLRGTYMELTKKNYYEGTTLQEDYVHITLTDEEEIPDVSAKLRMIYHGFMGMQYDNTRTKRNRLVELEESADEKTPLELFNSLFEQQNNREMTKEESSYIQSLMEEIWEGTQ